MAEARVIKEAFLRNAEVLAAKPAARLSTGRVEVHMREGLTCDIVSGPWTLRVDMPEAVGGEASGPRPGVLAAGALGSCLAIMVGLWAARLDVSIGPVTVEVEFDSDARVLFGVGDVPPRWKSLRYILTVESDAPEEEIRRVVELAHRQSHVRGDFEHPFAVGREVRIVAPAA